MIPTNQSTVSLRIWTHESSPLSLVVKNTEILVGLQPPPVSLAALGFIHMMAEVLRSSHQILVVVSPIVRKFLG